MNWTVIVPLKVLPNAKSRLAVSLTAAEHLALVEAIRADTLAAARVVARVLVVADAPSPDADLVQVSPGLNGALRDGAAHARTHWPEDGVAALVGDLPALRPDELAAVLHAPATRGFVPDAAGTGTTLLLAAPGAHFEPHYGIGSAAAHARDAERLDAGPGLRCDVDTLADLDAARALGLGPATAAVVHRWAGRVARSS